MPTVHLPEARAERELIQQAVAGSSAAQRTLYDRHVERVYRLVFRLAGDADMAADLTQEAFIRAFERLDEFRQDAAFGTWLHRIAVTIALGALRKNKRRAVHHVPLEDAAGVGSTDRNADPDLRSQLHEAIDALPDGYRTVFVMYEIEGYTHQEIADAMGFEVTTSKGQLFRARARLRQALRQFAGEQTQ